MLDNNHSSLQILYFRKVLKAMPPSSQVVGQTMRGVCQDFSSWPWPATWVLAIPAGSTASEQLFSIAGLFDTARRGQLNTETFELLTLQKVNQDILETEDISDSSEDENSENDPDGVGILEESASDLSDSDGEDEEQFLDCFEEGSDISTEGSAAEELEDDE